MKLLVSGLNPFKNYPLAALNLTKNPTIKGI